MNINDLIKSLQSAEQPVAINEPVIISALRIERAEEDDTVRLTGFVASLNANVRIEDERAFEEIKKLGRPGEITVRDAGDTKIHSRAINGVVVEAKVSPVRERTTSGGKVRRECSVVEIIGVRKSGFAISADDPFAV